MRDTAGRNEPARVPAGAATTSRVLVTQFGAVPDSRTDATAAVRAALSACRALPGSSLVFPRGRYDFWPEHGTVRTYHESNTHNLNPKTCVIVIEDFDALTVDGCGSLFVFHGQVQPVTVERSRGITLRDFRIDWDVPLTAQARVVDSSERHLDLRINAESPYQIEGGRLVFVGEGWQSPWWGTIEFDPVRRIVAPQTGDDCFGGGWDYVATELEPGIVRLAHRFARVPAKGQVLILRHNPRKHAGVFLLNSQNVALSGIALHHTGGLGILAQFCENLSVRNSEVVPNPDKDRLFSGHDDGVHVSNCRGQVTIANCRFAGLMDDPVNVHGTSVRIVETRRPDQVVCQFMHRESTGLEWCHAGDHVGFVRHDTLVTLAVGVIKRFAVRDALQFEVTFEEAIPAGIGVGDALENVTWTPDLRVTGCEFGSCRARGLLVSTPGRVMVEDNTFESSGSAILIDGDANGWYESGGVRNVHIRNNRFLPACLTSSYQFCEAIISICPEIPAPDAEAAYHRSIVIEANEFNPFDYPVLFARSVDGLRFRDNRIRRSHEFAPCHPRKEMWTFEICKNVEVGPNEVGGDVLGVQPQERQDVTRQAVAVGITPEMWGARGKTPPSEDARGAWFREARHALFIHWGLYSAIGGRWRGKTYYGIGEWIQQRAAIPANEYARVAATFNPTAFDARALVQLAKDAGMRYIVITAKHHDGFAMFRTAASPFNIVEATPFGRDPVAELAEACREGGLRLGFYYSQTQDWHEPDAPLNNRDAAPDADFHRYLRTKALPQIEELLTQYGEVALIWFDTPGPITHDDSLSLMETIRRLQPGCLVNSRIGNGLGDYETLGDQEVPRETRGGLWETIDTHNDTWGFTHADQNWKSARELVERLVRVVSRGGNYMLNVGPDGTGRVPALSARILREVGRWLSVHGEAIYGAGPSSLGVLPWGESTRRGSTVYLHVFQWPVSGLLRIPAIVSRVRSAVLLGQDAPLTVLLDDAGLTLQMPVASPSALLPVVALEVAGDRPCNTERHVLHSCVNVLDASEAQCEGCRRSTLSWMEKFGDWKHADCLGEWAGIGSRAAWTFTVVETGLYYLDVEYACPTAADGSTWCLALGDESLPFPMLASGHLPPRRDEKHDSQLARFRIDQVGLLDIRSAGRHTLTLQALDDEGSSLQLATVSLRPTAG